MRHLCTFRRTDTLLVHRIAYGMVKIGLCLKEFSRLLISIAREPVSHVSAKQEKSMKNPFCRKRKQVYQVLIFLLMSILKKAYVAVSNLRVIKGPSCLRSALELSSVELALVWGWVHTSKVLQVGFFFF